jgi:hypothetical protein
MRQRSGNSCQEKRAEVDRSRRVINPNFHNFNTAQAEAYLDGCPVLVRRMTVAEYAGVSNLPYLHDLERGVQ